MTICSAPNLFFGIDFLLSRLSSLNSPGSENAGQVSSRNSLWMKGETSGETLKVVEILTDCDQDVLLIRTEPQGKGAACHTGRSSCFYRRVEDGGLVFIDETRLFDPKLVY